MKLWEKGIHTEDQIIEFTAGKDRELDVRMAAFDVIASMAHIIMLSEVNLLKEDEKNKLVEELLNIYTSVEDGLFEIEEGVEDVHSQVEMILTRSLGDPGKKIHTARSRNDQVLTDLKLYYREEIGGILKQVAGFVEQLVQKSEETRDIPIPGYTHFQAAMPSSFGLWFGAWAESLTEDIMIMEGVLHYINQNPLGSAAGYGTSFPINRDRTTELLEFENLHVNSVNAQLARGKTEKFLLYGLSALAGTLSKMAMDMILFMSQNFNFLKLKEELTTGSSIMPHKKNPDVLELIRAKANRIQAKEAEINAVIMNLPSGYHRDFQLLKEICFPAMDELKECLSMASFTIENTLVNKDVLENDIYRYIGSVDAINEKVKQGVPFREAYIQVASEIDKGRFRPSGEINYTHTGSIGNPGNDRIMQKLQEIMERIQPEKISEFRENFIKRIKEEVQ